MLFARRFPALFWFAKSYQPPPLLRRYRRPVSPHPPPPCGARFYFLPTFTPCAARLVPVYEEWVPTVQTRPPYRTFPGEPALACQRSQFGFRHSHAVHVFRQLLCTACIYGHPYHSSIGVRGQWRIRLVSACLAA